ncbi:hypothetical protein ACEZCY_19965 [Streptacidiphilus sp. N1-12]|uniref:Uncharacterized protein n=2 Tax=Streptacidiphilus alkalitolerans TaxID=3342712 RepID=A0ABV6WHG7_9ACTN
MCDRRECLYAWQAVLGDRAGTDDVHPYCAPARATDLSGLPEHLYAHAFHAWDVLARQSALAKTFEHTWHDYLRRHLHS